MKLIIITLLLCIFAQGEAITLRTNHPDGVVVRLEESVELACSADSEVASCSFVTPDGDFMPFYPGGQFNAD